MTHAPDWMATAHPERSPWVRKVARAGFAAKGVVYLLIGLFAAQAALGRGGQVGGGREAVQTVGQQPFGQLLLILIGVGLLGYALWRVIEAVADPARHGSSGRGLVKRIGYAGSALMNGSLGVVALQLAAGASNRSSGEPDTYVGQLMQQPLGQLLVGAVGVAAIVSGMYQIREGYTKRFLREIDSSSLGGRTRAWVIRSGMIGLIARGVVFGIIGLFLVRAAIEHRPGRAVGVGGALRAVAMQPWGTTLLLIVAIGLMSYGVFQLVKAKYARLPGG